MDTPCAFFNKEGGCRNTAAECRRAHVPYCTNEICVEAKKQHTHTHARCGRKGGGEHAAFIAKKREASMAENAKKKAAKAAAEPVAEPVADPNAELKARVEKHIGNRLYDKVLEILKDDDSAMYVKLKETFPVPIDLPAERLAGKVVGMFLDAMDIGEWLDLIDDPDMLFEQVVEAMIVIHNHHKALAEELAK